MATPPKNPTDVTKPPAPRKPATPRKTTTRKTAAATAPGEPATPLRKTAAKSAATTPAKKPAAKRAPAARKAPAKTSSAGKKWGIAAVVGGVGAAVTAGLLALKGSTPVEDDAKPNKGEKAHQPDGADSSKSFEAGIADESTIPE